MRRFQQRIWLRIVVGLAFVVLALWIWQKIHAQQIIVLLNGDRYRFIGTTYGTNALPPSVACGLLNRLPTRLANAGYRLLGLPDAPHIRAVDERPGLFICFKASEGNGATNRGTWSDTWAMLADGQGIERGEKVPFISDHKWAFAFFSAVPRRSRVLRCSFYEQDSPTPVVAKVVLSNPLYRRFPQWHPEALPIKKKTGDMEVQLEQFSTGVGIRRPASIYRLPEVEYYAPQRGEEAQAIFEVVLKPKSITEGWRIQAAKLSDITGNTLRSYEDLSPRLLLTLGEYECTSPGTLWPDEAAWRLSLQLERTSNLEPDELMKFTYVRPLKSDSMKTTNTVGGMRLVLSEHPKPIAPTNVQSVVNLDRELKIELSGVKPDVQIDLLDTTGAVDPPRFVPGRKIAPDGLLWTTTIDSTTNAIMISWAMPKTRTVDFLIKPPAMAERPR
jgi:hypothetical protein